MSLNDMIYKNAVIGIAHLRKCYEEGLPKEVVIRDVNNLKRLINGSGKTLELKWFDKL